MAKISDLMASSLKKQLKRKGADEYHFNKLVDDYCVFYEIKQKLMKNINDEGTNLIEYNVKGFEVHKTNPSIAELTRVNAAMLKILDTLGVKADDNIKNDEGNDDTGL